MNYAELKLEAMDLIARCSHALDGKDPEAFVDLFTPEGTLVLQMKQEAPVSWQGRENLLDYIRHSYQERGEDQPRHHVRNTVFLETTDQRMVTSTYFLATLVSGKGGFAKVTASGLYQDEMVPMSSGWKILKRTAVYD